MTDGMTRADVMTWSGRTVIGRNGARIGKLEDIIYDTNSGQPEWGLVGKGLLRKRENVVPLAGFEPIDQKTMRVRWTEAEIEESPNVEVHGSLTHEEEQRLYEHYDIPAEERKR